MSERVRTPGSYPDRGEAWEQVHFRRRCRSVADLVTQERIDEHRGNPFGYREHHSLDLQRLDRMLKTYPARDTRHMPVLAADGRWRILTFRRHQEPALLDTPVCDTLDDAVHQIFLIRVEALQRFVQEEQ
jgi:hypothetical protein